MSLHNRVEELWWSQSTPPLWLRWLEPIYAAISRKHLKSRAADTRQPPLPMISVGNITAGGSGKTPFVLWLAGMLKFKGYTPVILCRGDGGRSRQPMLVSHDVSATMVGDEAKMLAELSGCPVIAARDRLAGCLLAEGLGDILILDDGFQYRHLARICDIVLIPAEGVGNGHMIPAGPMREPIESLARADVIVRTGSETAMTCCKPLSREKEWQWISETGDLIDVMNSGRERAGELFAVTSIARPQRFFDSLRVAGIELAGSRSYPDHHPFTEKDVAEILNLGAEIAVTAKDAVKLAPVWPKEKPLWLLRMRGAAEPGLDEAIAARLPKKESPAC